MAKGRGKSTPLIKALATAETPYMRKFNADLADLASGRLKLPTLTPAQFEQFAASVDKLRTLTRSAIEHVVDSVESLPTLTPPEVEQAVDNFFGHHHQQMAALAEAAATGPAWARRLAADVAELKADIGELRATRAPATSPKERPKPQGDRVSRVLPKIDIDGIPDAVVRQKVAKYLQPETKRGLKVPDRRSMDRAIRLYRNRIR